MFFSFVHFLCTRAARPLFFCAFQLNSIAYKKKIYVSRFVIFWKHYFICDKIPLFFGNLAVYVEKWQFFWFNILKFVISDIYTVFFVFVYQLNSVSIGWSFLIIRRHYDDTSVIFCVSITGSILPC